MYTKDTPLQDLTVGDLLSILNSQKQPQQPKQPRYVYGMMGLANLLNCSTVTAQKIKNSGKIPYMQDGRKVIFDGDKVLEALSSDK